MLEINLGEGVVWLFGFAAFLLAFACGFGVTSLTDGRDKSTEESAMGAGFLVFAITAVPWFTLLVWLFNGSPALQ